MELILKYFADFSEEQLAQLRAMEAVYKEWNEKINVISRKDIEGLYEKHVLHSLSIAAAFTFLPQTTVIDVGTGGGFPGIPLAIYFPQVKFHLVDSIGKKLKVVENVAASLGLQNVSTEHTRVEDIKNRKFDFAVSRAVAPLKDLWSWTKNLSKSGLICLKGGDLSQEISESGTRPKMMEIHEIFPEPYFADKYILYVSKP